MTNDFDMDELPASQERRKRDAYYSLVLAPIEYVTSSLRKGDPWALDDLKPFISRCRALVDAYDARISEARVNND